MPQLGLIHGVGLKMQRSAPWPRPLTASIPTITNKRVIARMHTQLYSI